LHGKESTPWIAALRRQPGAPSSEDQTTRAGNEPSIPSHHQMVSARALYGARSAGIPPEGKIMDFRTPKGATITDLCIDSSPDGSGTGKKIALRCKYNRGEKNIDLTCSPSLKILNVRDDKHGTINFVIEILAINVGERIAYVMADYDGAVLGNSYRLNETLRLKIGKVKLHNDFESDLLAQMLGMSSDADQLLAYYRVLSAKNNADLPRPQWDLLNDNPLKQNTGSDSKKWNCGGALLTFGQKYAPGHHRMGANLYYTTPAPLKLSQVGFKKDTVRAGAAKIRTLLRNGNFVQVFVGHNEDLRVEKGVIQPSGNTHYITLFGASKDGKQFIFFDPWPKGSRLLYKSGIMGDVNSVFMGTINFMEGEGKIRSPDSVAGSHKYVILTGP
jgi:hypothetical protein